MHRRRNSIKIRSTKIGRVCLTHWQHVSSIPVVRSDSHAFTMSSSSLKLRFQYKFCPPDKAITRRLYSLCILLYYGRGIKEDIEKTRVAEIAPRSGERSYKRLHQYLLILTSWCPWHTGFDVKEVMSILEKRSYLYHPGTMCPDTQGVQPYSKLILR